MCLIYSILFIVIDEIHLDFGMTGRYACASDRPKRIEWVEVVDLLSSSISSSFQLVLPFLESNIISYLWLHVIFMPDFIFNVFRSCLSLAASRRRFVLLVFLT